MKVQVLGVKVDGTVEIMSKDPDDPTFWRKYVGAEVDHVIVGHYVPTLGKTCFVTVWVDEWGLDKHLPQNTVATGLALCLGRNMNLVGDAVISCDFPEESVNVPREIVELARAVSTAHRVMGILSS